MPTMLTNVSHEDVLNEILANTCPNRDLDDDWREYEFDLHCATAIVEAKVISTWHTIKFEIRKVIIK